MRILLAEDEKDLNMIITKKLKKDGYSVDSCFDGEEALAYINAADYDCIILDVMMPLLDGFGVLKEIRKRGISTPVIFLTARDSVEDRVSGLDSGANDYLPKPFDTRELLARIRSITRTKTETDTKHTLGNITLDRATFELSSPAGSFRLANKEYQMMELFMHNPRQVISTDMFMEKIWGWDTEAEINVVWVYISYLRKKLTALGANIQIKSSRNAGYCLENCND